MTIMIAGIVFDQHHYDKRDDVLYLNVGAPRPAARSLEMADGHTVHYDESDSIIALTLLNVRRTIETEGYMDLTFPVVHLVDAASLREAFALHHRNPSTLGPKVPDGQFKDL
ncbi:MAG: DUF2283 domain-containing protein [Solirubrobacteraceae bacterium]